MKKILFISIIALLFSCSKDDEPERTLYDITYSVTAANGAIINNIEYMDGKGVIIELTDVSSPWTISFESRAGLGLQAVAYGDIPYQGSLSISATWKPEGGNLQGETETLPNETPNSTINNGSVEILGRTLPD